MTMANGVVWHYTGISGALNIVHDGVIKGKQISSFNQDKEEYIYGWDLLKDIRRDNNINLSDDG